MNMITLNPNPYQGKVHGQGFYERKHFWCQKLESANGKVGRTRTGSILWSQGGSVHLELKWSTSMSTDHSLGLLDLDLVYLRVLNGSNLPTARSRRWVLFNGPPAFLLPGCQLWSNAFTFKHILGHTLTCFKFVKFFVLILIPERTHNTTPV